jgi:hypothetical protein
VRAMFWEWRRSVVPVQSRVPRCLLAAAVVGTSCSGRFAVRILVYYRCRRRRRCPSRPRRCARPHALARCLGGQDGGDVWHALSRTYVRYDPKDREN